MWSAMGNILFQINSFFEVLFFLSVTLCNSYYTKNTKKSHKKHKFIIDNTVENELSKNGII